LFARANAAAAAAAVDAVLTMSSAASAASSSSCSSGRLSADLSQAAATTHTITESVAH
jgi:hypothetical protein